MDGGRAEGRPSRFGELLDAALPGQDGAARKSGSPHCAALPVGGGENHLAVLLAQSQGDGNALAFRPVKVPQLRVHPLRSSGHVLFAPGAEHSPAPAAGQIAVRKAGTGKSRFQAF